MENTDFDKSAKEHWEYVKEVLLTHGEDEAVVEKIGFHYVTAMKHGYKHGLEDKKAHKWKVVLPKRRARIKKEKVKEVDPIAFREKEEVPSISRHGLLSDTTNTGMA
jgi:hypothetical protein